MIPSVNQVIPGALVSHRYRHEIGIILRVEWNAVEVLLDSGAIVRWGIINVFLKVYEVVG